MLGKPKQVMYHGEMLTLDEIADKVGIPKSTIATRMSAYQCDAQTAADMYFARPKKTFLHEGEELTLAELCDRLHIKLSSVKATQYRYRISAEEAVKFCVECTTQLHEFRGEMLTLPEISTISKVHMAVLRNYMRTCNMTPEQAVDSVYRRRERNEGDLTPAQLRQQLAERICLQMFPSLECARFEVRDNECIFRGDTILYRVLFEGDYAYLTAEYGDGTKCSLNRQYRVR